MNDIIDDFIQEHICELFQIELNIRDHSAAFVTLRINESIEINLERNFFKRITEIVMVSVL
jgi:hypothetical protein